MGSNKANDDTVLGIQEIFEHINNFDYEEAFFLSSQLMARQETGDTMFHEWVKSLAEFYSCDRHDTAINLLETIKPDILENEIHFRVINSLVAFYKHIEDEENFIKYKNIIYPELHKLKNKELKLKIIFNISNAYYDFKDYKRALEYAEETIMMSKEYRMFDLKFSLSTIIKIVSLLYLGEIEQAESLKQDYLVFLKITDTVDHIGYLEEELKCFYNETGREKQ